MNSKLLFLLATLAYLTVSNLSWAQAPSLGTAANFALFTATGAISNSGASVVTGDIGTNVGAISGFLPTGPGIVIGTTRPQGSPQAMQAAIDVVTAYNSLSASPCGTVIGPELGGTTLLPGVSCQPTATATSLNRVVAWVIFSSL